MQESQFSRNDLTPGPQQLGRYRLVTTLGQGGMGTIHLAVMTGLGEFQKLVVVKELRRDLALNTDFVEMFLREAELAARLNHSNVVHTLEAGQVEDRFFLAMEFLDGQPFSELIRRANDEPKAPLQLRLQVICNALAGLHYAHELREYDGRPLHIVHRDVSPQNVFITYDGNVKVVDFGIAKAADANNNSGALLFKGKFGYAAPEQLSGQPVDRRTDVFAAGVMLWEAIALERFAAGAITQESIERRRSGKEPRIAEVVPNVDAELAHICDKALSTNPDERFASAEEFRTALSKCATRLGPWFDPAAIGEFISAQFASERIAMHRLIHSRVKGDESATSTVRALRTASLPSEEDATTVADLSELVEISRSSEAPRPVATETPLVPARWSDAPSFTPSRSRKLWVAVGVVGIVGAGIAALALMPGAAYDAETAPKQSPAQTQAVQPEKPEVTPAAVEQPTPVSTENARSPDERTRAGDDRASEDGEKRAAASRKRAASNPTVRQSARTATARAEDETETESAVYPEPTPVAEPKSRTEPSARPTPVKMGKDLRTAPQRARRALDLDNPFK